MAKFKGTNGNDTITGSAGDDSIVPLLGQDTVDGGMGYDTLVVDYSSVAIAAFLSQMTLQADGSWSGVLAGGHDDTLNFVGFQNVEQIKFTATQGADYLTIDLGALTPDKSRLTLDGSGGDDTLSVLGGELTKRLTLTVADTGKVKANFGVVSGWDHYDIGLGLAAGNKLVLGGGDDAVTSTGGQDTIDSGGGRDQWTGSYQSLDADGNFFYSTEIADATFDSGTVRLADVANAETFSLQTGGGDDVVTMYGGAGFFDGGGGSDQIALNPFGAGAPMRYEVYQANAAILAGDATPLGGSDGITFYAYEDIVLGGSSGADQYVFDASDFAFADSGFSVYFGVGEGGGDDSLTLNLGAQGPVSIARDYIGAGHINGLGASRSVGWSGIEAANVTLGAGDDTVAFGIAATTLTVDGGGGFDTIDFGYSGSDVTFDLGKTTAQSVDGILVTAQNVEGVIGSADDDHLVDNAASNFIQGGDGDDIISSSAASNAGFDGFEGGVGFDGIDYSSAGGAVYVSLAITTAQNTGGGGFDTLTGFEELIGSAYADVLTGSAGDDTLVGYLGDDLLEGGAGDDALYAGDGIDTVSYASAAAAVTVSLTLASQNTGGAGTDYLSLVENLVGSIYNDKLGGDGGANRLSGGRGADTLTGLGGADVFAYSSKLDSTASAYDTIADFSRAQGDKINLVAIDAKDGLNDPIRTNDAFTWIGSDAFHGVSGELREVGARGGGYFLYGDTNGDKVADLTIFVNSSTALLSTDIVL